MFKIAVCDDQETYCSQIETILREYEQVGGEALEVSLFYSGEELMVEFEQEKYFDLVFLDIEMKALNGVGVGRKLREGLGNYSTQIVYISSHETYYKELFDVQPLHFLLKPLDREKVIADLEKAMKLAGRRGGIFKYKKAGDVYKVSVEDILYFEAQGRNARIVCKAGEDSFSGKFQEIRRQMEKYQFLNIHKSYIVNPSLVAIYRYEEVAMVNGDILPISQPRRKELRGLRKKGGGR